MSTFTKGHKMRSRSVLYTDVAPASRNRNWHMVGAPEILGIDEQDMYLRLE